MRRINRRPTEMRALPCQLTADEVDRKGEEIARATMDERAYELAIAKLEDEHRAERKRFQTNLADMVGRRIQLAREVTTRLAERDIECEWIFNVFGGQAVLVRTDTGAAIERREMTDEERQLQLGESVKKPTDSQVSEWADQLAKREAEKAKGESAVPGEVPS